jgi:hypothetical protein
VETIWMRPADNRKTKITSSMFSRSIATYNKRKQYVALKLNEITSSANDKNKSNTKFHFYAFFLTHCRCKWSVVYWTSL